MSVLNNKELILYTQIRYQLIDTNLKNVIYESVKRI